ncbi:MAG: DNA mismatch endonuclease Vsr [Smithella sp.]|jgi:DNA mismatch endonuclease (patch repair protein)|nr:DNA mismatch endonuclease Vsr [Smithella sp.]
MPRTDVHDEKTRSYNMSRIRGKDTKPEILVRKFLFSNGFRYKLYDKVLPGKPDLVFPKYKTVVFIHGCFWHGHAGCRYFVIPKTRTGWWIAKIERNKQLDDENNAKLKRMGWKIITIFECGLRPKFRNSTLQLLAERLVK